jgi:hypothetical protein
MKAIIATFRRVRGQQWAELREDGRLICEYPVDDASRAALEARSAQLRTEANVLLHHAECLIEAAYRIL